MTAYIFRTNWRWVVTFFSFLQFIFMFGTFYNYSILFLSFQGEFNSGAMATGWVGSLANALSCLLSPVSSAILLRVSCRTGSILAVVSFCVGLFATSFATELWHTFLSFSVLTGFGANMLMVADYELLYQWLKGNSYYRAAALVTCGSSVGMIVMSSVLTFFISSHGWRLCLRVLSPVILVVNVLAALALRDPESMAKWRKFEALDTKAEGEVITCEVLLDRSTPKLDQSALPLHKAAMMDTRVCVPEKSASLTVVETRLATERAPPGKSESGGGVGERLNLSMFRLPYTWLYFFGYILANNAYTFAVVNMASFMDNLDFNKEDIALTISLLAVGECVGKFIVAAVSHLLSFSLMYLNGVCSVVAAIVTGMMLLADTLPALVMCSFVFGMMRSSLFAVSFGGSKQLFGEFGTPAVSAMATVPFGVGSLIAAPLTGGLFDNTGDYTLSLVVILVSFMTSSACFFLTPLKWKFKCLGQPSITFGMNGRES